MVAPLMDSQEVKEISNFRDIDLEHYWEKKLDIH